MPASCPGPRHCQDQTEDEAQGHGHDRHMSPGDREQVSDARACPERAALRRKAAAVADQQGAQDRPTPLACRLVDGHAQAAPYRLEKPRISRASLHRAVVLDPHPPANPARRKAAAVAVLARIAWPGDAGWLADKAHAVADAPRQARTRERQQRRTAGHRRARNRFPLEFCPALTRAPFAEPNRNDLSLVPRQRRRAVAGGFRPPQPEQRAGDKPEEEQLRGHAPDECCERD